jgi:hypothetical protein
MKIMSDPAMDIPEWMCVCFIDWHETFDRVYWTELIHILNKTCTHWREGSLISRLYRDHNVKVILQIPYCGVLSITLSTAALEFYRRYSVG